jgi:hypothetical protein
VSGRVEPPASHLQERRVLERRERLVEIARQRVRKPALLLSFAGVVQVALALLGGVVPPAVLAAVVAYSGGGSDAWAAVGVLGGFVLAAVVLNVVGGGLIAAGGTALLRLRSRTWTWAAVGLALPIAVHGASVQVVCLPFVGVLSGVASSLLTLVAAVLAGQVLQDPVVHAAFERE